MAYQERYSFSFDVTKTIEGTEPDVAGILVPG